MRGRGRRWLERRRTAGGRDRGSLSVELAAITPIILVLIMLCVQSGFYFHARQVAASAARAGVEAGRAEGATPADGVAQARAYLKSFGGSVNAPTVSAKGSTPERIRIQVDGTVATLVPGLTFTVHQHAEAPVERVTQP